MINWPSMPWFSARIFPLAGGNSEKSIYSSAQIFSTVLFGRAASPWPDGTGGFGFVAG